MAMQTMSDRYRRWFQYECDAHELVFGSLESVPVANRGNPEFLRALSLMGHLVAARRIWLARLGAIPIPADPLFPQETEIDRVRAAWSPVREQWLDFFSRLDDASIERVVAYRSYDGDPFENRLEDILTQLFGHSSYHRGQIAMLVRQAGGEPAKTDFIFWTRKAGG